MGDTKEEEKHKNVRKQAAMQFVAGGSAGLVEVSIMHPLDLVKTRLQLQPTITVIKDSDPHYYRGMFDCLKKMYRYEGVTSYWKGIIPPILAETPKRAVKFLTFEQCKTFFIFGSSTPTPMTFFLAGLCAGITEGFLLNPFEVVKVTLQSNTAFAGQVPSTWSVTKQIIRENGFGLKGLNKGLSATVTRNAVFNMFHFGVYHTVMGYIPDSEDPIMEFSRKFAVGFCSGVIGSCANIPFDVAKSRIQGPQPVSGVIKYKSTIRTILLVYHEEGLRALYKGLVPKVMRLGPGGAIMLVVYDYAYRYLEKRYQ